MTRLEILNAARLISVVEGSNVTDAELNLLIEQAMQEINVARRWRFLEDEVSITTVVDQQRYALPANFDYAIALVDDDFDDRLQFVSPAEFFNNWGNDTGNGATMSHAWTIWGKKNDAGTTGTATYVWLHPIPSTADTARYKLYYYRKITSLAVDADVPEFHKGFHWAIVEWVRWKLYEREEFWDASEKARQQFEKLLADMEKWYSNLAQQHPYMYGEAFHIRFPRDINLRALDVI